MGVNIHVYITLNIFYEFLKYIFHNVNMSILAK